MCARRVSAARRHRSDVTFPSKPARPLTKRQKQKFVYFKQGRGMFPFWGMSQHQVDDAFQNGQEADGSCSFEWDRSLVNIYQANTFLDGRTQQVMVFLLHKFFQKEGFDIKDEVPLKHRMISFSIADTLDLFGLSYHGAKKMFDRALQSLAHISLTVKDFESEVRDGVDGVIPSYSFFNFLDGIDVNGGWIPLSKVKSLRNSLFAYSLEHGVITVTLSEKFVLYLGKAYPFWFPLSLYKVVPARSPSAFAIGMKLAWNYYMNHDDDNGSKIGVEKLLAATTEIPLFKDLGPSDSPAKKIYYPLKDALNLLVSLGMLSYWKLVDKQNNDVEIEKGQKIDYEHSFKYLSVCYKLIDYPYSRVTKDDASIASLPPADDGSVDWDVLCQSDSLPDDLPVFGSSDSPLDCDQQSLF